MDSRLIVHPGFHKTGTTALQEALALARGNLQSQGIWYPDLGGDAHHRIAFALSGKSWGWENQGGKQVPRQEWTKVLRGIRKYPGVTVISSESLVELSHSQIEELSSELGDIQTKIVFTLRPLPSILVSVYQQYVKAGLRMPFNDWLQRELQENIVKRESRLWRRHSHDLVIKRWMKEFDNVTVIVADPQSPTFLFEAFESVIGAKLSTLQPEMVSNINRSLSLEELNLLIAINQQVHESMSWDEYLYFVRGSIRKSSNSMELTESGNRMGLPQWAFDLAKIEHVRQISEISSLGIQIIGNDMDEQILRTYVSENEVPQTISTAVVANMFQYFSFSEAIRRLSTRKLIREVLIRFGFSRESSFLRFLGAITRIRSNDRPKS